MLFLRKNSHHKNAVAILDFIGDLWVSGCMELNMLTSNCSDSPL